MGASPPEETANPTPTLDQLQHRTVARPKNSISSVPTLSAADAERVRLFASAEKAHMVTRGHGGLQINRRILALAHLVPLRRGALFGARQQEARGFSHVLYLIPTTAPARRVYRSDARSVGTKRAPWQRGNQQRHIRRPPQPRVSTSLAWLLIDLRRLFAIVPPGLGDAARVARFGRRPAEHIPVGQPVRGLVPVRNPIAAGADHPVEHLAGRRQACAAIGCDDLVDELIDNRIGNAGEILRAPQSGSL